MADSDRANAPPLPLTRASILSAHDAIAHQIHRTPIFTSSSLSTALPGKNTLFFKAENLQKGGAFKFRGASFSLSRLSADELAKGVCTHSSGTFVSFLVFSVCQRGALADCEGVLFSGRQPRRSPRSGCQRTRRQVLRRHGASQKRLSLSAQ